MARPPKITNEEILTAAREIFLKEGFSASTLAIAEKAGISEASIFKRFATKQALFLAAIGITENPKWVKTLSSQTPTAAIKEELIVICEQMLAFYLEVMPRVFMLMNRGDIPHPPPMPPPHLRDTYLLASFLDKAIALKHLRSCDTLTVAHMIVGPIINYIVSSNMDREMPIALPSMKHTFVEPSIFIHTLIETLWNGLAAEPTQNKSSK
ncbi:TetR/AcrR family transcriptional regulator [Pseudanabaena sp. 'Roaring Creek']|uniref:TetR/AcrR family transcriptional regulator n=1 Tax=Pseudanabaena sp. 'Roaring Creek' TaxID=1681830 RepID=UPI0006D7F975|nr:TetR/AcrR family transcriptional regulator [Pseudanabaena sp. 'Roaring Creek']